MALNKILLLSFVMGFFSCNAQENTNANSQDTTVSKPIPIVINQPMPHSSPPDFDSTLVSQYILSIFQDSKGNLWFGASNEGVVRYDVNTLTYYYKSQGYDCSRTYAINEDAHGNIWFGTDQGIYRYDGKTFQHYKEESGLENIDIARKGILVDRNGQIWVGTQGGVFLYHSSADTAGGKCFTRFALMNDERVRGVMEDNSGNIWFASMDNGVYRFDGKTISNLNEKEGLGENYSGGMLQDKAGNFWFTMEEGICRYDGETFTILTTNDGLGGNEVWGVYEETSGIIWIAARGSMTRYNPSADTTRGEQSFTVFTTDDGINCCVQSMYQDRSGNMWWGAGSGVYRFDGKRFYQVKQNGPW